MSLSSLKTITLFVFLTSLHCFSQLSTDEYNAAPQFYSTLDVSTNSSSASHTHQARFEANVDDLDMKFSAKLDMMGEFPIHFNCSFSFTDARSNETTKHFFNFKYRSYAFTENTPIWIWNGRFSEKRVSGKQHFHYSTADRRAIATLMKSSSDSGHADDKYQTNTPFLFITFVDAEGAINDIIPYLEPPERTENVPVASSESESDEADEYDDAGSTDDVGAEDRSHYSVKRDVHNANYFGGKLDRQPSLSFKLIKYISSGEGSVTEELRNNSRLYTKADEDFAYPDYYWLDLVVVTDYSYYRLYEAFSSLFPAEGLHLDSQRTHFIETFVCHVSNGIGMILAESLREDDSFGIHINLMAVVVSTPLDEDTRLVLANDVDLKEFIDVFQSQTRQFPDYDFVIGLTRDRASPETEQESVVDFQSSQEIKNEQSTSVCLHCSFTTIREHDISIIASSTVQILIESLLGSGSLEECKFEQKMLRLAWRLPETQLELVKGKVKSSDKCLKDKLRPPVDLRSLLEYKKRKISSTIQCKFWLGAHAIVCQDYAEDVCDVLICKQHKLTSMCQMSGKRPLQNASCALERSCHNGKCLPNPTSTTNSECLNGDANSKCYLLMSAFLNRNDLKENASAELAQICKKKYFVENCCETCKVLVDIFNSLANKSEEHNAHLTSSPAYYPTSGLITEEASNFSEDVSITDCSAPWQTSETMCLLLIDRANISLSDSTFACQSSNGSLFYFNSQDEWNSIQRFLNGSQVAQESTANKTSVWTSMEIIEDRLISHHGYIQVDDYSAFYNWTKQTDPNASLSSWSISLAFSSIRNETRQYCSASDGYYLFGGIECYENDDETISSSVSAILCRKPYRPSS